MRLKNVSSSQAASSRLVSAQQDKRGGDTLSSVWPGMLGRDRSQVLAWFWGGVQTLGTVPKKSQICEAPSQKVITA